MLQRKLSPPWIRRPTLTIVVRLLAAYIVIKRKLMSKLINTSHWGIYVRTLKQIVTGKDGKHINPEPSPTWLLQKNSFKKLTIFILKSTPAFLSLFLENFIVFPNLSHISAEQNGLRLNRSWFSLIDNKFLFSQQIPWKTRIYFLSYASDIKIFYFKRIKDIFL